jgi:hypothetical protein
LIIRVAIVLPAFCVESTPNSHGLQAKKRSLLKAGSLNNSLAPGLETLDHKQFSALLQNLDLIALAPEKEALGENIDLERLHVPFPFLRAEF